MTSVRDLTAKILANGGAAPKDIERILDQVDAILDATLAIEKLEDSKFRCLALKELAEMLDHKLTVMRKPHILAQSTLQ